ncbi:MAG TPA: hypothetical protein VFW77_02030 [Candidatus Saccharimonadales bacterium]|nr:hypothetical protein [Candidatus Saccharimonadales bacterium]
MAKNLEERIAAIEARNKKVEADKAWELSWTRRIAITVLIYLVIGVYLRFVVHISPWINGLVPVIGYFISTVTMQKLKQWWTNRN